MDTLLRLGRTPSARALAAVMVMVAISAISLFAGSPPEKSPEKTSGARPPEKSPTHMSVADARGRSRTMQSIYEASLHMMHHYYFDVGDSVRVPAKAMEDVFQFSDNETGATTYWISVNTPPMNVDHKPDTPFEKKAAQLLTDGQEEYDEVIDGKYYRAGALTLDGTCRNCHAPPLAGELDAQPLAAIVTIIPMEQDCTFGQPAIIRR